MPTENDPDRPVVVDVHLDVETFCALDLKKAGLHNYMRHPSFRVLAAAIKVGAEPVLRQAFPPSPAQSFASFLTVALTAAPLPADCMFRVHAWNVAFEYEVLQNALQPGDCDELRNARHWSCTMQRALAYGLPGSLERAADAVGSPARKNMLGRRLMLAMSKPVAKTGRAFWEGKSDAEVATLFNDLSAYCADDVHAEVRVGAVIPELPEVERIAAGIDRAMNLSGVAFDLRTVAAFRAVAERATEAEARAVAGLSNGEVTNPATQPIRLRAWFNRLLTANGFAHQMKGVGKDDVEEALALPNISGAVVLSEALRSRQRAAKSSVAKLQRIEEQSNADGRAMWQFQFMGAGRTGRWAGRGVQVQNLPRTPKGFDAAKAILWARAGGPPEGLPNNLGALDNVAGALRSCIVPAMQDTVLFSYDFSQIEARVIAWLAGQHDIVARFAAGDDVYTYAAAQVGSQDRQLGKVMTLALGFGMGAQKFMETAKAYGVVLTLDQADRYKMAWRLTNKSVVTFWWDVERAARDAIEKRGSVQESRGVRFQTTARTMQVRLPSGRLLYYHAPMIDADGGLTYLGVDIAKRWVTTRTYGGKLVENIVQATARDVMSTAMVRVAGSTGRVPVMTVHDELTYEMGRVAAQAEAHLLAKIIGQTPLWAPGLPIAGDWRVGERYGK